MPHSALMKTVEILVLDIGPYFNITQLRVLKEALSTGLELRNLDTSFSLFYILELMDTYCASDRQSDEPLIIISKDSKAGDEFLDRLHSALITFFTANDSADLTATLSTHPDEQIGHFIAQANDLICQCMEGVPERRDLSNLPLSWALPVELGLVVIGATLETCGDTAAIIAKITERIPFENPEANAEIESEEDAKRWNEETIARNLHLSFLSWRNNLFNTTSDPTRFAAGYSITAEVISKLQALLEKSPAAEILTTLPEAPYDWALIGTLTFKKATP